jgi:hypothetical protein
VRRLLVIAAGCVVALALVGPASADRPIRIPLTPGGGATYAAGEACEFPVTGTEVVNASVVTLFFAKNGDLSRVLVTGRIVVRVTNDVTGKSVTLNVSGPVEITDITPESERDTLLGPSLLHLRTGDVAPVGVSVPGLYLTSGRVQFVARYDPETGAFLGKTVVSQQGTMTDICAMIRPAI